MLLVLRNHTYIYTQFDAQNDGNSVSELPDFKFFSGGIPPDPLSKRGLAAPCQYRRLLFSNWLPTSNFIETPVNVINYYYYYYYYHYYFVSRQLQQGTTPPTVKHGSQK